MKWILTLTVLTFMSFVFAEDYACPDGKSKKSITIKKDQSFNFDIAPGYGPKTKCGVVYKPQRKGKTKCKKIKFSCTTFDLPNKSGPPKCKKGDKLKVGKQFFCKTKSPDVESTKPIKLMFLSDKKDSSGAATCTIMCADTATAPPPTTTTGPSTPSDCKCGLANRVTKIVGGQNVEVNEYPWQAGIVSKGSVKPWCGGSLVNSRWVLTAAHCTAGATSNNIQILLGDHKTNQNDHEVFNVEAIQDHESYDSQTFDYDFSMIKLSTEVDWAANPRIRPVCIPTEPSGVDFAGATATVTGWGTTSSGGSQPNTLKEVDVGVISNFQCGNDYGYSSDRITDSMLCAVVPGGGKDACQGDSGGPLVFTPGDGVTPGNHNYKLIGVVSWGIGCAEANYPGVYARVTNQRSWIQNWMATAGETCPYL